MKHSLALLGYLLIALSVPLGLFISWVVLSVTDWAVPAVALFVPAIPFLAFAYWCLKRSGHAESESTFWVKAAALVGVALALYFFGLLFGDWPFR